MNAGVCSAPNEGRAREEGVCDALAIVRYDYLPAENVGGLLKGQVIRHSMEVAVVLGHLYSNCLEEKGFAFHVHMQCSHLPVSRYNFRLLNLKRASPVQVSQYSKSEFDILHEVAIERYHPLLLGIDRHLTFHTVEDPGLKRRRLKSRVRCEIECYEVPFTTGIAEHKNVRQYPEQTRSLLCFPVALLL